MQLLGISCDQFTNGLTIHGVHKFQYRFGKYTHVQARTLQTRII